MEGPEGLPLSHALLLAGVAELGQGPDGAPRGLYCVMGACGACRVRVDGRVVEACRVPLRTGLNAGPA